MTLPRSSGCTRTSRTRPPLIRRARTRTSSGCSTIPRTRCSSASSSTSALALDFGDLGGLGLGLLRLGLLLGLRRGDVGLGVAHRLLDGGLEGGLLVRPRLGDPEGALGAGLALEL